MMDQLLNSNSSDIVNQSNNLDADNNKPPYEEGDELDVLRGPSFDKIDDIDFDTSDLGVLDEGYDGVGANDDLEKLFAAEGIFGVDDNKATDDGDNDNSNNNNDHDDSNDLSDNLVVEDLFDSDIKDLGSLGDSGAVGDDNASQSSIDHLLSMKMFEVDDPNTQTAASSAYYEDNHVDQPPSVDPLLGELSGSFSGEQRQHQQQQYHFHDQEQQQPQYNQNYGIQEQEHNQSLSNDTTEIQFMVDKAMHNQNTVDGFGGIPSGLSQLGTLELEQEKLKLLKRLQEINLRQQQPSSGVVSAHSLFGQDQHQQDELPTSQILSSSSSPFMQMQHQASRPRQPLVTTTTATTVASVSSLGGGPGGGETPLQSFLRSKGAGGTAMGNPAPSGSGGSSSSLFGQTKAASILDAAPMDFGMSSSNPFLRGTGAGGLAGLRSASGHRTGANPLMGAMDRSTLTQDLIRKLSSQSLRASGNSGQNLMAGDNMYGGGGGQSLNAGWGVPSSGGVATIRGVGGRTKDFFRTSGIIPKHASDGHLLAAGAVGASMAKTKNRLGSLSRENSLYNLMSHNKNRLGSQHKNLGMLNRQSSNQSLGREDSTGSLLPTKRGGRVGGIAKYKMAGSRSVPHIVPNGGHSTTRPSTLSGQGNQQNAMW